MGIRNKKTETSKLFSYYVFWNYDLKNLQCVKPNVNCVFVFGFLDVAPTTYGKRLPISNK